MAVLDSFRAKALYAQGYLAYNQGDNAGARSLHEESLALFRELGDKAGIASSLLSLARRTAEFGRVAQR